MESWAGALADRDEELQGKIKAKMPRFITLQNVGPEEFNILAACVAGENIDVVKAVAEVDLVRAIDPEQGPWVMALRPAAVEALARMQVDELLLGRWVRHVVGFHGEPRTSTAVDSPPRPQRVSRSCVAWRSRNTWRSSSAVTDDTTLHEEPNHV
jgi:hypothetical protein